MTARKAGSVALSSWLWMTTNSVCGSDLKPDCFRICSARCDSPTLASSFASCFVPTCIPTTSEARTKASQPKTAVFQWFALHRPMRAAMLLERMRGDMALLRVVLAFCHHVRIASFRPKCGQLASRGADARTGGGRLHPALPSATYGCFRRVSSGHGGGQTPAMAERGGVDSGAASILAWWPADRHVCGTIVTPSAQ